MLRASASVAKRLQFLSQFRALIEIPKNARGETGVLVQEKEHGEVFSLSLCSEN
jgi:hypothetical protein